MILIATLYVVSYVSIAKGLVLVLILILALILGAAAEGWAVVGGGGIVGLLGSLLPCRSGAAQRGLVAALAVVDLALVLDAGQARLDIVELGGGDHVVRPGGQDGGDLFLGVDDAVGGLRVVGEDLGQRAGLVLFQRVESFRRTG